MKKILCILFVAVCSLQMAEAQEKPNKNKKVEFAVGGNCEMCKKRIEKAAYSVSGVKNANWSTENGNISLILDERKTSAADVQKAIAKVGHDAGKVRATDADYEKLHHCCMYDRLPIKEKK
ncbi:MAG: cation transporter [Capnocytophaga sp.]|nr:cation transporter [Capnocytophaga sp.]